MGWLSRVFYGVDLDEEQARQDELDAKLKLENERDHAAGALSDELFYEYERNREDNYISDVAGEVRNAFNTELNARANNVRDFAGDTIGFSILTPLKLIPWQVWLIGLAWAAWQFGWIAKLLAKVKK